MKRSYVYLALLIAVLLAVPSQGLSAQPLGAGESIATPGETRTRDATQYSQQFNVSVDEARKRLDQQFEIGMLNAALTEQEARVFGGLWIEH